MSHQAVQYKVCPECKTKNRLHSWSEENKRKQAVCGACQTPLHQEPSSESTISEITNATEAMQDRMDRQLYRMGAINENGASSSGFGDYLGLLFLIIFLGGFALMIFFGLFELIF